MEAFPEQEFAGEVAALVPRTDYQWRMFPVKVRMPNRRHQRTGADNEEGKVASRK